MANILHIKRHVMCWVRVALAVTVVLGAYGCSTDEVTAPGMDGGNVGAEGGTIGSAGLEFLFRIQPEPISIEGSGPFELDLATAAFSLRNVRAVGESATGDGRTARDELQLHWPRNNSTQIYVLDFPDAPVGIYSYLLAQIVDYQITGTVVVDNMRYEFEVEDELDQSLSLMIDLEQLVLPINQIEKVEVTLDICKSVCDLPWDTVERDKDELSITSGPLLDRIRSDLINSFTATING